MPSSPCWTALTSGYRLGTMFKDFEAAAAEHDELAAVEPDLDQRDIAA